MCLFFVLFAPGIGNAISYYYILTTKQDRVDSNLMGNQERILNLSRLPRDTTKIARPSLITYKTKDCRTTHDDFLPKKCHPKISVKTIMGYTLNVAAPKTKYYIRQED